MTDKQWNDLLGVIDGKILDPLPVGFIIDSPWLPNWCGKTILDFFTSDETWLQSNLRAIKTFPECMFLPGFWSNTACAASRRHSARPAFSRRMNSRTQKSAFIPLRTSTGWRPRIQKRTAWRPLFWNRLVLHRRKSRSRAIGSGFRCRAAR